MFELVALDDPILESHRVYLGTVAVTQSAAEREHIALAELVDLVCRSDWIDPEVIWFLYWHTPVPIKNFAHHLEVPVGQVGSVLQPGRSRDCDSCGEYAPMPNRQAIKANGFQCVSCVVDARRLVETRWLSMEASRADYKARLAELAAMPYHEYLLTPEWQERRQIMYRRAGYRCQVCSATGVILDVHHNTYENRGNEDSKDLVVLCRRCHARHHGKSA